MSEPIKPWNAGTHDQKMTPAIQSVIDAAYKRERDKAAMPADCPTPSGCRDNGCHGECLPMSEPIKLPEMSFDFYSGLADVNQYNDVRAYARLAVEQNTAALRAERDALRAELAAMTKRANDEYLAAIAHRDWSELHRVQRDAARIVREEAIDRAEKAEAECDALRADAERLDWITRMIPGDALRWIGVEWPAWSPENARAAIDAARAALKEVDRE